MIKLVYDRDTPQRLSKYLSLALPELSRGYFLQLLKQKDVKINGVRTSKDIEVPCGATVELYLDESKLRAKAALRCAYEDDDIAVMFKPRGITTETFASGVASSRPTLILMHRLDTNTEGLLVFAKNPAAEELLADGFKQGYVHKRYMARLVGELYKPLILTAYLVKDAQKSAVRVYDSEVKDSKIIKTNVFPLSYDEADGTTLADIELLTGRTHQIRAHLAHVGYPVVGDTKYGDFAANRRLKKSKQMLSACKITFDFPPKSRLVRLNGVVITADTDLK